jgi:hypothetical protein
MAKTVKELVSPSIQMRWRYPWQAAETLIFAVSKGLAVHVVNLDGAKTDGEIFKARYGPPIFSREERKALPLHVGRARSI